MSTIYLLDTSVVVELFRSNASVLARLKGQPAMLCSPVMGELYFGARKAAHPDTQRQKVDTFAAAIPVFAVDKTTADHYSAIKFALLAKGKPIPENDMWIAAIAMQHGFTLATRDKHFAEVDKLPVEMW